MKTHELADLEDMIDKYSLSEVLAELASICYDKAEHIRQSYDDRVTARTWEKAGARVISASNNVGV